MFQLFNDTMFQLYNYSMFQLFNDTIIQLLDDVQKVKFQVVYVMLSLSKHLIFKLID